MKKGFSLRTVSLVLVLIMLTSMIPFTAANATETLNLDAGDVTIGNFTGDEHSGMTGEDSFRVSATGTMATDLGFDAQTATVTMTVNSAGFDRILVFDYYTMLSAPASAAGAVYFLESTNGSSPVPAPVTGCYEYSHLISAGETFSLTVAAVSAEGPNTTAVDVENIRLIESFEYSSFYIDYDYDYGTVYSERFEYEEDVATPESEEAPFEEYIRTGHDIIAMYAEAEPGYEFVAYVDDETGAVLSNYARFDYKPVYDGQVVRAVFAPASDGDDAAFQVGLDGDYYCDSFEQALEYAGYASDRVIAVNQSDVTISGGSYTIPRGVTLLVPFDDDRTMYTSVPENTTGVPATLSTDSLYCCLTLANGAHVNVDKGAAISVSSKHPATTNGTLKVNGQVVPNNGAVSGEYSQLQLNAGTGITLMDGSNLYAWGFITGDGLIEAMSGSVVYEFIQINDYRGGSATSAMSSADKNQFFFNQYYVQNIEAGLKIYYGAIEYVAMDLYVSSTTVMVHRPFIGDSEEGAFRLDTPGSYIMKKYDPAHDVMNYDVYGTASLHSIEISAMGITLSTEHCYLPINDIVVNILPGSEMNMEKKVIFMPGSGATVAEDAVINISGEGSVVFADTEDPAINVYSVNNSIPCRPVTFSPTRPEEVSRTWADTEDAYLDNSGTVNVTDSGTLSSTSGGANIYGDGAFSIESTAEPPALTVAIGSAASSVASQPTATASLTNEDDSEVNMDVRWTTPATFRKVNGVWGDYRKVTLYEDDHTTVVKTSEGAQDELLTYDQFTEAAGGFLYGVSKPAKADDTYYTYSFDAWVLSDEATTDTHVKFYPSYTQDGKDFPVYWYYSEEAGSTYEISYEKFGTKPTGYPSYEKEPTAEKVYKLKWKLAGSATLYTSEGLPTVSESNIVNGCVTYYADFSTMEDRKYDITWQDYLGGYIATSSVKYSARPNRGAPGSPVPSGGTFVGWMNSDGDIYARGSLPYVYLTGEATYRAAYSLTVTWYDSDGSTLGTTTGYTNRRPAPAAEYAALGEKDGNRFIGWTNDGGVHVYDNASIPVLTGPITGSISYTAVYENNVRGKTLSLYGLIGENIMFYNNVTDASLSYTVTETGVEKSGESFDSDDKSVTVRLAPAEMTYDITAQYTVNNGGAVLTRIFTAHGYDYAESMFSNHPADGGDAELGAFYVVGTIEGEAHWADSIRTEYKLYENRDGSNNVIANQYKIDHVYLKAGDEIKVLQYNGSNETNGWYPNGNNNNYPISEDGYYWILLSTTDEYDYSYWWYNHLHVEKEDPETCISYAFKVTSALMNYATEAQLLFGRNVTDLANDHVNGNVYTYDVDDTDDRIVAFDAAHPNTMAALKTGETADAFKADYGMTYYGSNYILNAGTSLHHYFFVYDESKVPETINYTLKGITYTAKKVRDNAYYVHYVIDCDENIVDDVPGPGIAGPELGEVITVSFIGGAHAYSGNYNLFNYAKLALDGGKETCDLLRAMYWYYIEAKSYFDRTNA